MNRRCVFWPVARIVAGTTPPAIHRTDPAAWTRRVGRTHRRCGGLSVAPAKGQAFGNKAKEALAEAVHEKTVRVVWKEKDRYGRIVGDVNLGDRNINLEQIRNGWAWWYRDYAPKSGTLERAEADARKEHRGLWHDKNPDPPWEVRKKERERKEREREEKQQRKAAECQTSTRSLSSFKRSPASGLHILRVPPCHAFGGLMPMQAVRRLLEGPETEPDTMMVHCDGD